MSTLLDLNLPTFNGHCEERSDAMRSVDGAYATSNAEHRATERSSTLWNRV